MSHLRLCAGFLFRLYGFLNSHSTLVIIFQIIFLLLTTWMAIGMSVRKKVAYFFCGLIRRLTKSFKKAKPKADNKRNACKCEVKGSGSSVIVYQVILLVFSMLSILFLLITCDDFHIVPQVLASLSVWMILGFFIRFVLTKSCWQKIR